MFVPQNRWLFLRCGSSTKWEAKFRWQQKTYFQLQVERLPETPETWYRNNVPLSQRNVSQLRAEEVLLISKQRKRLDPERQNLALSLATTHPCC